MNVVVCDTYGTFWDVGLTFVSLVFSSIPSNSVRILFCYDFSSILAMILFSVSRILSPRPIKCLKFNGRLEELLL